MLADLDELVLRCRDERARAYIRESVACCKAGAYRSAIVSAWIAVAFDIIDKIHELSLAGDKNAANLIQEFEDIVAKHEPSRALAFERRLLSIAKDDFELISAQEHTDLERLQQDRHRCAHPSHSKFGEVFSPPAELARLHVRAAVEHLLQHEPAQGKAALERLVREIFSEYFPSKHADALAYLTNSALKRARPSLVRNLMMVLFKTVLDPTQEVRQALNSRRGLKCVRDMHPAMWRDVIRAELTRLYRNLGEPVELVKAIELLNLDAVLVEELGSDQLIRLQEFIRELPTEHIEILEDALRIPNFAQATRYRVARLSAKEIRNATWFGAPQPVLTHMIERYSGVTSFDSANEWGRTIRGAAYEFSPEEARSILVAASKNSQIQGSFQLTGVIADLKKHANIPEPEFEQLAEAATGGNAADSGADDAGTF